MNSCSTDNPTLGKLKLTAHCLLPTNSECRTNYFCKFIRLAAGGLAGVFAFLDGDVLQRVIDDFASVNARKAPASGPDAMPAADRDGQDGDIRVERHANSAGLESEHLAVWEAAPSFRIDDHRAAASEPLRCPA